MGRLVATLADVAIELILLSRVAYRGQEVTAPRLRGLLALLAADLRTGCGTARLVDGLWPDAQPENPVKALQLLVTRARSQLGSALIATTATGYRLDLRDDQVDAAAVLVSAAASARSARAGDHAAALTHAEAGLALWNGEPAVPAGDDPVATLRAEREPTYRSLVRARALALARLGRAAEAVDPLRALVAARPQDEELLLELLRCEAATAGPAAALARYETYRSELREQLGTDPGPALQAAYKQLLQGTAPPVRHGLAYEPNQLLGREDDIAAVAALLRSCRVTSIVGPGGLGKTRLAQVVSRQAEQRVVQFVPLAGVTGDADVAGEVAAAVGAGESRRQRNPPMPDDRLASDRSSAGVVAGIAAALGPGPALLVLDNCEHVLDGVAGLVQALVALTPDLRVLTTSRAPLGLSSESVYRLPELDLATSVTLFQQRARAARPAVDLPAEQVVEVCRQLDGLPLAVELAAARIRMMSVAELTRRLADRFSVLRGGPRDAPQRHHTLHAVVEWSWSLLGPAGQAAMRALSVFPDGFTADAAGYLLKDTDILEQLVDQSLLAVADTPAGTRLRMLETVREFSAGQRDAAGETEQHTAGFLAWARDFGAAHHEAVVGADPYAPVQRIRAEQDNLVHALRLGLARSDGATVAATVAVLGSLWGAIDSHYDRLGRLAQESDWVLSHFRPEPGQVEVTRTALTFLTGFWFQQGRQRAVRSLVSLRRLPPAPSDTGVRAVANLLLGREEAATADADPPMLAGIVHSLATYRYENEGDLAGALAAGRQALAAVERTGSVWLPTQARARLAELCLQVEQGAEAQQHLLAALPVLERLGAVADVAGIRWWLVLCSLQLGDLAQAQNWLEQAAPDGADDLAGMAAGFAEYGLGVRAELQLARGEVEAGLRLWRRAVDRLRSTIDDQPTRQLFLEALAVAVVAHAQHGRLDLVGDLTSELPEQLAAVLSQPAAEPLPLLGAQAPLQGALLLALAMVDLDRGARTGDQDATRSGVRMVALAQRIGYVKGFQPTMASARIRQAALDADRPAYEDAVSSYAGLTRDELRGQEILRR